MKKRILLPILAVFIHSFALAQSTLKVLVKDSKNKEPLVGAIVQVKALKKGASANGDGLAVLENLPDTKHTFTVSFIGCQTQEKTLTLPFENTVEILLQAENEALDEVIIQGTRSNRSIDDIPTRVEALTEEIDEAGTMDPSKISHLITHSTGIQVQQTSATSNTANVRIQGLDGRYTQILKDGFPLYGGFSGSLSIMQIPPLDLRQVEYIKGGASTLYGGGAIAGLINLISKEPKANETLIHLNASQLGALDVNTFLSRKFEKFGITLLAQRNTHRVFDANADGYSDLPQLTKYNFNPKIFYQFNEKTQLSIGATLTTETRQGGDLALMNNEPITGKNFYKEINDINRTTTQTKFEHNIDAHQTITFRNSFNFFRRSMLITPSFSLGNYQFAGKQTSSFSEFAYSNCNGKNVLNVGLNYYTDNFKEIPLQATNLRNEGFRTLGAFAQYTFDATEKLALEAGLRTDYVLNDKAYILPRVSALMKWTPKLTTRIGGGLGYRNASIFNQEAEILGYRNVNVLNRNIAKNEESYGGGVDIGYKTTFGEHFFISFNQMFFYSKVNKPLILKQNGQNFEFSNANGYTQSVGGETFFKFGFYDFVWFVGYTYTDANNFFNDQRAILPLTPKHSLKGDLLYALPGKWRIGADYEFKSSQTLSNGRTTRSFWTYGLVVEYTHKEFTFFGNVENFTNLRQTQFEDMRSAPYQTPQFTEVWAPIDGFVFNYGIKLRL